jgi:TIR domain
MKVFISYAHGDRDVAQDLAKPLADSGYEVLDPAQELGPGDNWALKIGEALEACQAMIVLVSPDSAKSEWVRREIEFALGSASYEHRLISVQVRPTVNMPWILRKLPLIRLDKNRAETVKHIVDQLDLAKV